MSRPLHINRAEGEFLVELLEACGSDQDGAYLAPALAAAIRELFGMAPRDREQEAGT